MGRRVSAVILAALLALTVAGCGDDADDEPTNEQTSQTDETTESSDPTDTGGTDESGDVANGKDEDDNGDDDKGKDDDDDGDDDDKGGHDDADDNGAIPDDLESNEPTDPDDLVIDAQVVLDTCEDVEPKDTWPAVGDISFDGSAQSVVATAEVKMKGGPTVTVVCAIAGSNQNPQVKAYNPIS